MADEMKKHIAAAADTQPFELADSQTIEQSEHVSGSVVVAKRFGQNPDRRAPRISGMMSWKFVLSVLIEADQS